MEDINTKVTSFMTEQGYLFQVFFMAMDSEEYIDLFDYIENSISEPWEP